MHNFKTVIIVFILICGAQCLGTPTFAGPSLTITKFFPSITGEYNRFRLLPRANLTDPCTIGSLYVNNAGALQYCQDNSGTGTWGSTKEEWTQIIDAIYLTDTPTNTNLKVGIGTVTPEFKLSLGNTGDGGIVAIGTFGSGATLPSLGAGSRFIWYPRKASLRAGYVDGTQWDDSNIGNYSVAFGKNTIANGTFSTVGGGDSNTASGSHSVIGGGQGNLASGNVSAIGGGKDNTASGQYSVIWGGENNLASADYTAILGGLNNQATAIYAIVAGGVNNVVSTPYSNINGGLNNTIDYVGSGIVEGYSVIGGGKNNSARHDYTVVSGGENNTALAPYASIGGGLTNTAGLSTLGVITGDYARISGGQLNTATANYTSISGGESNISSGIYSVVGGGLQNTASGAYATVGGGERNTASGDYSMIMGGTDNIAAGDYSWAGGKNMQLSNYADNTFAWGYSETPVSITTPNAFIIAPGTISGNPWNPKVGIRDITPTGALEINANSSTDNYLALGKSASGDIFIVKNNGYIGVGKITPSVGTHAMQFANNAHVTAGGVWTNSSSRKLKENISPLSSADAQQTLEQLQPVLFNYKATPNQTNVGFIAEDVPDLVAINGRHSLSSMNIIAILTKVIQNQQKDIEKQNQRIIDIRKKIKLLHKPVEY